MNAVASPMPSLDPLDAAFVLRFAAPTAAPRGHEPDESRAHPGENQAAHPPPVVAEVEAASVVGRLLASSAAEWQRLADHVEEACRRGSRVIAVAGGTRGEGRTTVVDGVVATLRARGRAPVRVDEGAICQRVAPDRDSVVLVDAGVWFPPGPIRAARVMALAQGCDAAILVRRAEEPSCPARADILAHIGVRCLGEVETFAA